MKFLVFEIYGAMASWGQVAVGEVRRSEALPTRSAVLGLCAAALGIDRSDAAKHKRLEAAFKLGIRQDDPGQCITDYHTIETPYGKQVGYYHSRKEALETGDTGTMLTSREYQCDASYTVAVWAPQEEALLEEVVLAMRHPEFCLYLGRKACVPAVPILGEVIDAASLAQAFEKCRHVRDVLPNRVQKQVADTMRVEWDDDPDLVLGDVLKPEFVFNRRDKVHDRERWQFKNRKVHAGSMVLSAD